MMQRNEGKKKRKRKERKKEMKDEGKQWERQEISSRKF